MTIPDSPIELYLDELAGEAAGLPVRRLRHLLAETEAHLRDAADAELAAGQTEHEAETDAVRRFGPVRDLVRAERAAVTPMREFALQVLRSGVLLGGVGAVAVGISGVIAAVIRSIGGSNAIASAHGHVLAASDCARWQKLDPHAVSCAAAAVRDWADETVYYRIAFGVVGIVAVLAARALLRTARFPRPQLDRRVTDTIATSLFSAAAAWTFTLGIDAVLIDSGRGSGQWFSATPVALAGATFFGVRLVHELRSRPA